MTCGFKVAIVDKTENWDGRSIYSLVTIIAMCY
jgi:hypothetical protein